jgi:hypothetical protein
MKPPYVCPGCFIHTYSNNMINRCHIQKYKVLIPYRMTLGSKEIYINAATNYAWDELPQASINRLRDPASIPDFHPQFHLKQRCMQVE